MIKENWEKKVSKFCKIVLISDFINRKSFCDYYLNYNLPYESSEVTKNLKKKCIKLIGPSYSITKDLPNLKIKKKNKKKIVVFMGGVDAKDYTSRLISILSDKLFLNFEKIIVIGEKNKKMNILMKQAKDIKNFKILIGNKKNLYPFFWNSKLVITSLGTSMHEHLTLGLNSIVIIQNKIQKKVMKNMSLFNLINFISKKKDINKNYLYKILNQKNLFEKRKNLLSIFDTKGVNRIVDYFTSSNILYNAKLSRASFNDKFFLFKLVNDPQAIKNSLSNKSINLKEHEKWFEKTIKKENSKILIFQTSKHKLGQIRFDKISKNKTLITYSVANEFRGRNIGYKMLNLAFRKNLFKTPLYAIVKKSNEASNNIFRKLGFEILKNYQKNNFIYCLKKN